MPFHSKRTFLAVIVAATTAAACAQPSRPPVLVETPPPASPAPPPEPPAAVAAPAVSPDKSGVSADVFYRLMVGEIALQRGESAVAARAFFEAARETGDLALTRRAAEIAMMGRQRETAELAAKLWLELEPGAERPRQMLAVLAAGAFTGAQEELGDSELRARLERFLAEAARTGPGVGEPFLQINRVFNQQSDKRVVFRLISDLARPYPDAAESHFAVALAGLNTGLTDEAIAKASLEAADRALVIKPGWDRAMLLRAEILAKRSPGEAIAYLEDAVRKTPDSRPLKGALAQLLTEQKRYVEARDLYRKLLEADPTQQELKFGIAVLSVQMKDWTVAEAELLELRQAKFGDAGQVEFYLAQVSEERGRLDEAIERYRDVPEGERGWISKLRIGLVMGKQGKRDEGRRWLADLPAVTIEQRIQVRQTEAQIYRDANEHTTALTIIDQALQEHPEASDLLYDRAMVLEKLDRVDDAIKALRRLVELKPDDAQSLNALGYTLVDRTPNIDEGYKLVLRAHELAPTDPFILDSVGWALYRLGRLDEAEKFLARAFFERPDPEIAAHLGEVLFARGEPQKARAIWQTQLKSSPDHPVLLETMRRHSH